MSQTRLLDPRKQTRKDHRRTGPGLLFITSDASVSAFCRPIPVSQRPEMDDGVKGGRKVFCGGIKRTRGKTHIWFSRSD